MGSRPHTRLIALAVFTAVALCVTPLAAQETVADDGSTAVDFALDPAWEHFRVSIGAFLMRFDSLIRLDSEEHGIGTEIHLEDDLGFDSDNIDLRIFANYRLGKRSDLTFGYYRWNRGADHVIDEEIQWGDYIIEVGASIDLRNRTKVAQVSYEYSVLKKKKWDLGLSAGLSLFNFDFNLEIDGTIRPIEEEDGDEIGGGTKQSNDLVAPVPAFGLNLRYSIGPDLGATLRGQFFALQADTWGGSMADIVLAVDWFPWKHVGLGAGFNLVRLNYDSDKKGELKVDYDYNGVIVYVTLIY